MPTTLHRIDFRAMASPCECQLWCDYGTRARAALEAARDEVLRIEAKYSRYRDDSVIGTINRNAGGAPIRIDDETVALFEFAARCYEQSDGRFDITSGVLRHAWNFRDAIVPEQKQVDALLPLIGWHRVERGDREIRLPLAGMELDLGGFGKEYAADRAAGVLAERGFRHALVNLGGDVRVLGPQADDRPWRIAIQHPRREDALLARIEVSDGALATSGDYERYFERDGVRYSHVLDPRSGRPVAGPQSVTVQGPLCTVSGVHATLAMLLGDDARGYLDSCGMSYLLVDRTGSVSGTIGA